MAAPQNTAVSSAAWSSQSNQYAVSSLISIPEAISTAAAELMKLQHPIVFLDVAAGPATLGMQVAKRVAVLNEAARIIVTDFAPGMVEAAAKRFAEAELPPNISVECEVMDGQALTLGDATVTHVGCMFGIMFYPDRALGLRELRRVLFPGGECVVGTWRSAGAAAVAADFAAYLGLPPLGSNEATAAVKRMSEVGKDPVVLREELLAAGFSTVEVHTAVSTYVSTDFGVFLSMLRNNPALGIMFQGAPDSIDWAHSWRTFLGPGGPGAQYAPDGVTLRVNFTANVALAVA